MNLEISKNEKHEYLDEYEQIANKKNKKIYSNYMEKFCKNILFNCIEHATEEIIDNYTYTELLLDMYIIYKNAIFNNNKISIYLLSFKYKVLCILYSLLYNETIYIHSLDEIENCKNLTDIDIINIKDSWLENNHIPDNILNLYSLLLDEKSLNINSSIIYNNNLKEHKSSWKDISLFTTEYIKQYNDILMSKQTISILNMNEIYFIYFIPIAILLNKSLHYKNSDIINHKTHFIIGDHNSKENVDMLIVNKYFNGLNGLNVTYKHSIFFNYTINQFIIHSIKLDDEHMLGKIFSYISIRKNILYYKHYILQLPETYTLKQNILYIKKKKIQLPNIIKSLHDEPNSYPLYQNILIKNKSKRLISLTIQSNHDTLTKDICYRIYSYILYKYPYCNNIHINNNTLQNIYLYNNEDIHDDFINNSLFSIHFVIKQSKIVLSYSEIVHNYINHIILELNNILEKSTIHMFLSKTGPIQYILNYSNKYNHIVSKPYTYKMNIVEFLNTFGYCRIKSFSIYYYKYFNTLWDINDINNVIKTSNRIKKNPKSMDLGYHFITELELDIGIHIIIEQTKSIHFYVKEDIMYTYKQRGITLNTLNTYNNLDNIDNTISIIDLFTNIYNECPDFVYFSNTFNCSKLSLSISKNLLKYNVNEYIKLQNKLENNLNIAHIIECISESHKCTTQLYKYIPYNLGIYLINNFSTKLLDNSLLSVKILDNIKKVSNQKKKKNT